MDRRASITVGVYLLGLVDWCPCGFTKCVKGDSHPDENNADVQMLA